jgi:hypothetical protein
MFSLRASTPTKPLYKKKIFAFSAQKSFGRPGRNKAGGDDMEKSGASEALAVTQPRIKSKLHWM